MDRKIHTVRDSDDLIACQTDTSSEWLETERWYLTTAFFHTFISSPFSIILTLFVGTQPQQYITTDTNTHPKDSRWCVVT